MPSSTISNKESQLLFSPDPASLEHTICEEVRSLPIDNNNSVSLDSAQPPSTQTPVPSKDSHSPLSIYNTNLPSTNTLHPTSIDIPYRTSIDTEPRALVSPLILVRDNNGDLHDQEGHMCNAAVVKEEKLQEDDFEVESLMSFGRSHWCRSTPTTEHRSTYTNQDRSTGVPEHRSKTPTESTAYCNAVKVLTHEEFAAKHPNPPSPDNVRIDRHTDSNIDRYSEANIDQQPSPPIDRRASITYRVQMPKIDVARLNTLRPKPKPSEQPPEPVRTPSDDGDDPMEEDRVSTGGTLRRRKEKVCGAEYESDYSESIDTHPVLSIDTSHPKSTDSAKEKSVDTHPDEWENDY
ncbi:hypothetical protein F2Q69_00012523 [Brassica cretica]|uniref:Uncharacterized protein n=1 Tax=Brassica cretica TaxID=69181 RepID=A0A8S9QYM5_BRACR|nr:hypothetical protein F2Q69_00012523 [Brassica cretica]